MTATRPALIEGMKAAGLPLTSLAHGTYTEVTRPRRLAYKTLVDFIQGVAPYEVAAAVEIQPVGGRVRMVVTEDAMHDELWTERSTMGMNSSLDRLAKGLDARLGERRTLRGRKTWQSGSIMKGLAGRSAEQSRRCHDSSPPFLWSDLVDRLRKRPRVAPEGLGCVLRFTGTASVGGQHEHRAA